MGWRTPCLAKEAESSLMDSSLRLADSYELLVGAMYAFRVERLFHYDVYEVSVFVLLHG